MNVDQLRRAIAKLPDDMPVVIPHEIGVEHEFDLVIVPANRDRHGWIAEGHLKLDNEWSRQVYSGHTNISALCIGGYPEDGENITPEIPPRVINGEAIGEVI